MGGVLLYQWVWSILLHLVQQSIRVAWRVVPGSSGVKRSPARGCGLPHYLLRVAVVDSSDMFSQN